MTAPDPPGFHLIFRALERIERRLERIEQAVRADVTLTAAMTLNQEEQMATLADLETKVAEVTTVEESAVVLITDIHQRLLDALAAGDPTRLQALVDELGTSSQSLAAAVAANTGTSDT